MERKEKVKLYSDEKCYQEIKGFASQTPIRLGEKIEQVAWLKNTSPNFLVDKIAIKSMDEDVTINVEKTQLKPFEKTKVTIIMNPRLDRETTINASLYIESEAISL